MQKATKAQLEARKKRRERHKPDRRAWRMYFAAIIRRYNQGGYRALAYLSESPN